MDKHKREHKARRVKDYEEEEEWLTQEEPEVDEEKGMKQKERKVEERELKKGSCSRYKREWAALSHIWK